jgi:hypothetical protein
VGFPSEALYYDQKWQKMHKGLDRVPKKNKGKKRAVWWAAKMALKDEEEAGVWGIAGYPPEVCAVTQEAAKVLVPALLPPTQHIGTTSKSGPDKGYSCPPCLMLPLPPPLLLPPPLQVDLTTAVAAGGGAAAVEAEEELSPTSIVESVLEECANVLAAGQTKMSAAAEMLAAAAPNSSEQTAAAAATEAAARRAAAAAATAAQQTAAAAATEAE